MRIAVGILAIILLVAGGVLYLLVPESDPMTVGIMIRVGALLGVIWLAMPQLAAYQGRVPAMLIGLGLLCLAALAARRNLGVMLITLLTIGISVGGAMKWMSKVADNGNPRK